MAEQKAPTISIHPESTDWGKHVDSSLDEIKTTQTEHGKQLAAISKRIALAGPLLGSIVALATMAAPHVPTWLVAALKLVGGAP